VAGWYGDAHAARRRRTRREEGTFSERKFAFTDRTGEVARITPTTAVFSFHPDAYAFEMLRPAFTPIVAIGIAQCLREAVKSTRNSRA
jgi:hypothetical protein